MEEAWLGSPLVCTGSPLIRHWLNIFERRRAESPIESRTVNARFYKDFGSDLDWYGSGRKPNGQGPHRGLLSLARPREVQQGFSKELASVSKFFFAPGEFSWHVERQKRNIELSRSDYTLRSETRT